jgi:tRNA dimethylallyltransferase
MYAVAKIDESLNKEIDQTIEQQGWEKIYKWILTKDPALKKTVHFNDKYRLRRAYELIRLSEKSPLELEKNLTVSPIADFKKIKVALFAEKEILKSRVETRAKEMLASGFIEEVDELLRKGFQDWPPLQSVGYKEVGKYLKGEISKEDLLPSITLGNMKLIKKQLTWFRKDPEIKWFPIDKIAQAKAYAIEFLSAD